MITDTDASEKMLEENIKPFGVPLLVLPAITLVDKDGVRPPHKIVF